MSAVPEFVRIVPKNSREEVRVALSEFNGAPLCDVRVYADYKAGAVDCRGPTKKGVSVRLETLPALIEALQAAHGEAVASGLVGG